MQFGLLSLPVLQSIPITMIPVVQKVLISGDLQMLDIIIAIAKNHECPQSFMEILYRFQRKFEKDLVEADAASR